MKDNFKFDLIAGFSVFLVAIPLCLGIALACGAPLMSGLMAGIIGGIVVGTLSDSHLSVSGPAAGLVAIVLVGISDLGSYSAFVTALVLAGVIQIALGLVKAGKLTSLLPHSVIEGMMAAIGIILMMKQFPVLLGETSVAPYHSTVLSLGILSLIVLLVWDTFFSQRVKLVPGSLVVVVVGVVATLIVGNLDSNFFVQIPSINSIAQFKEILVLPDWNAFSNPLIYKTAIVLALVASIESLLCINGIERLDPLGRQTNKNRELIAQGMGNTFSGLIGGLPITSVIVRSSVNLNAGARSKVSAIWHGVLIVLVLLFGTTMMNHVPLVSLAAVLMFTGYKLAHPKHFIAAWKTGKIDFIAFCVTALVVVLNDLLIGVVAGIVVWYLLKRFEKKKVVVATSRF